jgi:outer membrane immunogenic protein
MKFLHAHVAFTLLAFALPAQGADLTEVPLELAVPAPLFSWTGAYGGLRGGIGFANADVKVQGLNDASTQYDGGQIGGFLGANYQMDSIVVGIEGDLSYGWNEKDFDFLGTSVKVGTDMSGSVLGRVGYALDHTLLYATAGWTATRAYTAIAGSDEDSETINGWAVGAGLDYAFTDTVFGRGEYRYNDYGSKAIGGTEVDLNQQVVSAGIGIKF